jgi:S-adenosylmethionine:tRNA ribosyltransferase-isomerase
MPDCWWSIAHNSLDHIRDLPEILQAGDCLVLNETKVIPARLVGYRTQTGGRWGASGAQSDGFGSSWHTPGKTNPRRIDHALNAAGVEDIEMALLPRIGGTLNLPAQTLNILLERVGRIPRLPYIRRGDD